MSFLLCSIFSTGCVIQAPSITLSQSVTGTELALWATQSFSQGESIGRQGYWGKFAVRKPARDNRTVELELDVVVPRHENEDSVGDTVTKTLLLVGDERCALTYVNDPTRGAAKKHKIQPNCRLEYSNNRDMMLQGNPSICDCVT